MKNINEGIYLNSVQNSLERVNMYLDNRNEKYSLELYSLEQYIMKFGKCSMLDSNAVDSLYVLVRDYGTYSQVIISDNIDKVSSFISGMLSVLE